MKHVSTNVSNRVSKARRPKSAPKLTHEPKYRRQSSAAGDRAFVELNGKRHYLGEYGSEESRGAYHRALAEWRAAGKQSPEAPADLMMVELSARYAEHAAIYYRKPDGTPTNEAHNIRLATGYSESKPPKPYPLMQLYGRTPAAEFDSVRLEAVRHRMIELGWVRNQINKHVGRIRRMFKWAARKKLIPNAVYADLCTVDGLKCGRSEAVESDPVQPVADGTVDATIPHLSPTVAAMVQFMRYTGARAGEVCIMRTCDIDVSNPIWTFKPYHHKTAHMKKSRVVYIGAKAQAVLQPYLQTELESFVFSPAQSMAEHRERRHEDRETPASCGNVPGSNVKRFAKKQPGEVFNVNALNKAIAYACRKAFPAPKELEPAARKEWARSHRWTTHQLRHAFATRVRREHTADVAQVLLGHSSLSTTEIYAKADASKAIEAMLRVG